MSENNRNPIEFLQTVVDWFHQQHQCALITIFKTVGHTPRRVGSQYALRADGLFMGSVSGGCAEDALMTEINKNFPQQPTTLYFGGTNKHAKAALSCGGEIELALEPIIQVTDFENIIKTLGNGQTISRYYHLGTAESYLKKTSANAGFEYSSPWIKQVYGSRWRLLIIGAVEISHFLAPMATMLDFNVSICDPRTAYQNAWRLEQYTIDQHYPDAFLEQNDIDAYSAVVTLTHDLRYDDIALIDALPSNAFYVGALGSRKTTEKRLQRLKEINMKDTELAKLHAPIGLDIGSRQASEIAVSILAEIIAYRSQVTA